VQARDGEGNVPEHQIRSHRTTEDDRYHPRMLQREYRADLEPISPDSSIDIPRLRRYRLQRVRAEMATLEIAACILSDPVNIRYATDLRNMQIFTARNAPSRYLLLTQSQAILYEFTGCMHLADGNETITDIRPALTASFVAAGAKIAEREIAWAQEMADTLRQLVGARARIGMERMNAGAAIALAGHGFPIVDAQQPLEIARSIKSEDEIHCVRASLHSTEDAMAHMQRALVPGISENDLWSRLHQRVIAQGADYCETRLLSSGQRTNPWFQETGSKIVAPNELVAFDTDVVGRFGYYSDFSRTFHSGPDTPSAAQRTLYLVAHEQIHHNIGILKPGLSFREYSERAWEIPEKYLSNRYYLSAHGCGMTGEYPYLYHRLDYASAGYDGILMPGMTICVEGYIGEQGGREGVKLEQQCLITQTGVEVLSRFPFERALLGSH
jgi:Xaa-Pro aminopeptidase